MKKLLNKVITAAITVALSVAIVICGNNPAQAITYDFSWKGNGGYSATGSFSYDENTAPEQFSESGPGATKALQSLNVSFFNPAGNLADTYNNVVNGISTAQYFKFNFNKITKEIFGLIDLGGEAAGESYLKGTVNTDLSWYQVPQSGPDTIGDSNSGNIVVK